MPKALLPNNLDVILFEQRVVRYDRYLFNIRLRNYDAVEGVSMIQRQFMGMQDMTYLNRQTLNTVQIHLVRNE